MAMGFELRTPTADELDEVVRALREWQREGLPLQLHPGDLGWYWRFGAEAMAAALRAWSSDGQLAGIGFLDGADVLRMTLAPELRRDDVLASQVLADVTDPHRGVLPAGKSSIELPDGTRVRELLVEAGWRAGEAWTPLRRDLSEPVQHRGLRVEVIESGHEPEFTAVHRSAWGSTQFTDELWRTMAAGLPYADARCLLGYDDHGVAVAGVTVWSAGPGKPGLIEPLGVHAEHRGHGYARAICISAAANLQEMGASSALVCTPSALTAAVATYRSAGFGRLRERFDLVRFPGMGV